MGFGGVLVGRMTEAPETLKPKTKLNPADVRCRALFTRV